MESPQEPWHAGEIAVQERAGVRANAQRATRMLHDEIPEIAHAFLRDQPWIVMTARTEAGTVWITQLIATPGFLDTPDARHLHIAALPSPYDPITPVLRNGASLGLLAIEPQTRRRMRINGRIERLEDGLLLRAEQVYANCPKYIQARRWTLATHILAPEMQYGAVLTEYQRRWIAAADTFFIGSAHAHAGADASHRGGNPGFVEVCDADTLRWPDYIGNNLFNTLGNLALDARAGLLYMDFAAGHMLQLTGTATVKWEPTDVERYPGAQRLIEFQVAQVAETRNASALRWELLERSPFNP